MSKQGNIQDVREHWNRILYMIPNDHERLWFVQGVQLAMNKHENNQTCLPLQQLANMFANVAPANMTDDVRQEIPVLLSQVNLSFNADDTRPHVMSMVRETERNLNAIPQDHWNRILHMIPNDEDRLLFVQIVARAMKKHENDQKSLPLQQLAYLFEYVAPINMTDDARQEVSVLLSQVNNSFNADYTHTRPQVISMVQETERSLTVNGVPQAVVGVVPQADGSDTSSLSNSATRRERAIGVTPPPAAAAAAAAATATAPTGHNNNLRELNPPHGVDGDGNNVLQQGSTGSGSIIGQQEEEKLRVGGTGS